MLQLISTQKIKVYCALQGVPPETETIACFSVVFNLKSSILS